MPFYYNYTLVSLTALLILCAHYIYILAINGSLFGIFLTHFVGLVEILPFVVRMTAEVESTVSVI